MKKRYFFHYGWLEWMERDEYLSRDWVYEGTDGEYDIVRENVEFKPEYRYTKI